MFTGVYIYDCNKRKIEHTYKTKYFALQFTLRMFTNYIYTNKYQFWFNVNYRARAKPRNPPYSHIRTNGHFRSFDATTASLFQHKYLIYNELRIFLSTQRIIPFRFTDNTYCYAHITNCAISTFFERQTSLFFRSNGQNLHFSNVNPEEYIYL